MNGKLILGLLVAVLMIGDASAQSGAKRYGSSSASAQSSSKNYGSSSKSKKMERFERDQMVMMAKKITKEHFTDIKLDRNQKSELKKLVMDNYQDLSKLETQMQALIPAQDVSDVRKAYKKSLREGSSESEAMAMGMKSAELPEMIQDKVMKLKDQSDVIMQDIATDVSDLFNDEQKEILMARAEAEKEMMMAKEETDKAKMMEGSDSSKEEMMAKVETEEMAMKMKQSINGGMSSATDDIN